MHPVEDAVAPLVGVPSWLVRNGNGSFVTLEFGQPKVVIGEPRMSRLSIDGAPPGAMRRSARVQGQWHLWIYCCFWSLSLDTTQIAHNESDDVTIERALHLLNGQAITAVTISPVDGSTKFSFDLGCVMTTTPAPEHVYSSTTVEQWMLYQPSGEVLTIRSDGMYSLEPGGTTSADARWTPLPRPA